MTYITKRLDHAAGVIDTFPTFTDNLNGTFNVGDCTVLLYDNANHIGELKKYVVTGLTNQSTTVNVTSYLIANYNSGSPIFQVTTDVSGINESDVVPVVTIYNEDDILLHTLEWDHLGRGLANKLHARWVKTNRFGRESGLVLSSVPTRVVEVTSGVAWFGAVKTTLDAFNSVSDRWVFFYHSSGSWTKFADTTAFNNTQYDDGTDLQSLVNNQYGVNWIFRDADTEAHAAYMLGADSYGSLAAAVSAPMPTPPPEANSHGILVGRIIAQEGSDTAIQIDSSFETTFQGTPVSSHNDLATLQGGTTSQYYHLTAAEEAAYFTPTMSEIYANPTHPDHPSFDTITDVRAGFPVQLWNAGITESDIIQIYDTTTSGLGLVITTTDTGGIIDATPTITNGGADYRVGQVVSVDGGNYDARIRISSVSGGVADGITLLDGGTGFTGGSGITNTTIMGFIINTTGRYDLDALCHVSAATAAELHVVWTIAGASTNIPQLKVLSHRDVGSGDAVGTTGNNGFLEITAGEFLYPEAYTAADETLTFEHANLTIKRVK